MVFLGIIDSPSQQASDNVLDINSTSNNYTPINEIPSNPLYQDPIASNIDYSEDEKIYTIINSNFITKVSSFHGGAIKSVDIIEEGSSGSAKHQGSYLNNQFDKSDYSDSTIIQLKPLNNDYIGYFATTNKDVFDINTDLGHSSLRNNSKIDDNGYFSFNDYDQLDSLELVFESPNLIKKITFYKNSYVISHDLDIKNPRIVEKGLWIAQNGLCPTEKTLYDDAQYGYGLVSADGDLDYIQHIQSDDIPDPIVNGRFEWGAIRSKYFISSFITPFNRSSINMSAMPNSQHNIYDHFPQFNMYIKIDGSSSRYISYIGPLDIKHLHDSKIKTFNLDQTMDLGWWIMRPISRGILWVVNLLHTVLPGPLSNYGIILILFAFLVRLVTGPLTKKSFESNQRLQVVQPKMNAIREKYKSDSQRMNQELIKLYRDEGVNPMGGCLPMLIQMPLLVSLFTVFRTTIEFRGQGLIGDNYHWISDLSKPDVIPYTDLLGLNSIPLISYFYGHGIGLLPIINGIVMIFTMKMTSKTMAPEQKPTMFIMQGVFMLLFNTFPAGLNLYYTTYNILSYLQQRNVRDGSAGLQEKFKSKK